MRNASRRSSVGVSPRGRPARVATAACLVHEQIAGLERPGQAAGAPQHRAHAGKQLLERERLDQVVIGAEGEPGKPVVQPVAGREEDDRDVSRGSQPLCEGEAVVAWQHHVEHRQVGRRGEDSLGLATARERRHDVPFGAERRDDRVPQRVLVFDDDDPSLARVLTHDPIIPVAS